MHCNIIDCTDIHRQRHSHRYRPMSMLHAHTVIRTSTVVPAHASYCAYVCTMRYVDTHSTSQKLNPSTNATSYIMFEPKRSADVLKVRALVVVVVVVLVVLVVLVVVVVSGSISITAHASYCAYVSKYIYIYIYNIILIIVITTLY